MSKCGIMALNMINHGLAEEVVLMETNTLNYAEKLHNEIDQTPEEHQAVLFSIVHSYRESVLKQNTQAKRLAETQEALEDIKAGRLMDGDKVMSWLDSWGTDAEQTAPKL